MHCLARTVMRPPAPLLGSLPTRVCLIARGWARQRQSPTLAFRRNVPIKGVETFQLVVFSSRLMLPTGQYHLAIHVSRKASTSSSRFAFLLHRSVPREQPRDVLVPCFLTPPYVRLLALKALARRIQHNIGDRIIGIAPGQKNGIDPEARALITTTSIRFSTEKPDKRKPQKIAAPFIADETPRRSIGAVGMTISLEGSMRAASA
jgi:hypothetical protein